jgi:glycerol-3-phosphate dehydrogenase subunit B
VKNQLDKPARHYDVIVIGAGLSGLVAASALVERGARVLLVAKGGGFLHFTAGCIDVLGEEPSGRVITDPSRAISELVVRNPTHPYALLANGATQPIVALEAGLDVFQRVTSSFDYRFNGDLHHNLTLPTALGSMRTTCLAPPTMIAGSLNDSEPMLIVGFMHFRDFYPPYIAANLRTFVPFAVYSTYLDIPVFQQRHLTSLDVARSFEDESYRAQIAREVRASMHGAKRVGFPAVLGLDHPHQVLTDLQDRLGVPVFEIPTLPPSVPGVRLATMFRRWLSSHGARVEIGFWVRGRIEHARAIEILVESAARTTRYTADSFVLATGGIGGGGIQATPEGSLRELVFDLPVEGPSDRTQWSRADFLGREPQPISLVGLRTTTHLQPLDTSGYPITNLFITASNLPGWDPTREKSGEGVALATGWQAAEGAASPNHRLREQIRNDWRQTAESTEHYRGA